MTQARHQGRSDSPDAEPAAPEVTPGAGDDAYQPQHIPVWNNIISLVGLFISGSGLILLLTFGLFSTITPSSNPYMDIVGFLVIPSYLVLGVGIVVVGILLKRWRLRRSNPDIRLLALMPRIDLADPKQQRTAMWFLGVIILLLPVVAVTGYHGFHYTDSVDFCASVCHTVMEPQSVTFEFSPHARVACAECHVGPGATSFVKAKLSGTRQVLAVWQDTFPRPIPSDIARLRPARDTCEECHWERKYFGSQLREITHYSGDASNSRRNIRMIVKTGGGDESTGRAEGIHMHMTLAGQIDYIATDETHQEIPWVKWTKRNGTELIYRADGRPSSDPPPEGPRRRVDCMDCHNRPAHRFGSPWETVDVYLHVERIDATLPYIKRTAVEVLSRSYPDRERAQREIATAITEYYREKHPDVWASKRASVEQAIDSVQEIYRRNFFPEMKVNWTTYSDNSGHLHSPGCFRCHSGRHVNQFGDQISTDCHVCHTFLNPVDDVKHELSEGEFVHSFQSEGLHGEVQCWQCHTGGALEPSCEGCHDFQQATYTASAAELTAFGVEANPMLDSVDCEGCHDLSEPASLEAIDALCMDCHEDEEERFEGMLESWVKSLQSARGKAESALKKVSKLVEAQDPEKLDPSIASWFSQCEAALDLLAKANPVHNPEGAKKVYERVSREAEEIFAILEGSTR